MNCHPTDINGLVLFAGRPNLVSARVPSRFVSALPGIFPGGWGVKAAGG